MAGDPSADNPNVSQVTNRLASLAIAKEFFLTEWFIDAARRMQLDAYAEDFLRIREETQDELVRVQGAAGELAAALASSQKEDEPPDLILNITRRDFLHVLIEMKEAAGEAVEKTADLAPSPWLRDKFLELAAIDFRHATRLREIMRETEGAAAAEEAGR